MGAIGAALSPDVTVLIIFRFILGLGVGLASVVMPLYISETSPTGARGAFTSLYQLMIIAGILTAYLVNYALAFAEAWRWMLGLAFVPAAVMFVGMYFLPETPRWLISKGLTDRARAVLRRTRDERGAEEEIRAIQQIEGRSERRAGWRELFVPWVRPMLMVGLGLAVLQQIVGINTIIYYAPTIINSTGFSDVASILATVGIGVVNLLMTVVAILLIDRVGRKPLLLFGAAGMFVALAMLGLGFLLPGRLGATAWITVAG